jgi:PEP-CTERM motif
MAKILWPAIMSAAVALAASHASATSYLYTYTGNDLTGVTSACCGAPDTPFTTSDFISFQFRSTALLGPNEDDTPFAAPISSFRLSVGPLHYSSADAGSIIYSINFSTDALGQITGYQFVTQTDVVAPHLQPPVYPPTPYEEEVFSFDLPAIGYGPEDGVYIPSIAQDSTYAYNAGPPGTWTISAVPEPSSWTMLLLGVGGAGAVLRSARRKRAPLSAAG